MAFNDDWYSDYQLRTLSNLARFVRALDGAVIEIGCWEGKSTCALANEIYPETVLAIDTWQGSSDEHPEHASVEIAKNRDVLAVFKSNVEALTKGNVSPIVSDCHKYMESFQSPVKFCHIDACHDYKSVKESLVNVLPLLVPGGVLCGDDIVTANLSRKDLEGGVERAVRECLPDFRADGNLWFWVRPYRTPQAS